MFSSLATLVHLKRLFFVGLGRLKTETGKYALRGHCVPPAIILGRRVPMPQVSAPVVMGTVFEVWRLATIVS